MLSATATRRFATLLGAGATALLTACGTIQMGTPTSGVRIALPGMTPPPPPAPTVALGEYMIINEITEGQRAAQGLPAVDLDKAFLGWKSPAHDTFNLVQRTGANNLRLESFGRVPLFYELSVGQALKLADCRGKNRAQAPFDAGCVEPKMPSQLTARHTSVRATLDIPVNCTERTSLVTKPQGTGLYTTCTLVNGGTVTSSLAQQTPEGVRVVREAFVPR